MAIVIHPLVFTKRNPVKEEWHEPAAGIGKDTLIYCVAWPKSINLKPDNITTLVRPIKDVSISDSLMPLTASPSGSTEPQLVAEHTLYSEDDTFIVSTHKQISIILSGRTVVRLSPGKSIAVNKLSKVGAFQAIAFDGKNICKPTDYTVAPYRLKQSCVKLNLWDQPKRVKHTNASIIAANGLLLG